MDKPLISIIIPVYNTKIYLEDCLQSIINQSYEKIEILCVDDGSTDGSQDILNAYAKKDERIKVLNKKNEGASLARNYALKYVNGEYIMFVDSDDWLTHTTCEIALDTILKENVDLVMWGYVRETEETSLVKNIYDRDIHFDASAVKNKLYRRMFGPVGEELSIPENMDALCIVWGKLYKSKIIRENNIEFYDIRKIGTFEDGLFNIDYLKHTNSAIFLNQALYHYRRNANSVTRSYNPNLQTKHEHIHKYLYDYIKSNKLGDEYSIALSNRIALELLGYGLNIMGNTQGKQKYKQIRQILINPVYSNAFRNLDTKFLPIHWRLFYGCAKYRVTLGVLILLIVIRKIVSWREKGCLKFL